MKRYLCAVLLALGMTDTASAQVVNGVVTAYVDLYAGPDVGYPPIAQLPAGTPVSVQGCLAGWTWCDVITAGTRGWIAGTFVQYTYQSQPVIVADYGARIGIPIVAFSIGVYWDNYYRNRPFYRNRDYWYGRPYAPRPPPRPPGWHPGYRPPPNPGQRPPPPPSHRPPPNQGHHPSPPANRPPPQGNRPPPQGNRPPSSPGHHPPPNQGNRPPPNQGHQPSPGHGPPPGGNPRPPSQGGHPPQGGHQGGNHGGQKPPQKPPGNQG